MNQANACLYFGRTMHARLHPFRHRFTYRVFSIFIDIDTAASAARGLKLFSYNRPNVFSFCDKDHGDRSGAPLRPWVERRLAQAGVDIGAGRIRLLCFPRLFGHVFNPLSVFYCYDEAGVLAAIVYEVNNTFGETHSYVAPAAVEGGIARQEAEKIFYVSPFFEAEGRYHFTVKPPAERLALHIRETHDGRDVLLATLDGERKPLTDRALALAFAAYPLMTLKVVAAIHFEALRLWRKGAQYVRREKKPQQTASLGRAVMRAHGSRGGDDFLPTR